MWRSKKFIIVVSLVAIVLAGSITGIAFAQTGNDDSGQSKTLMARVAEKLGINQQDLENAFTQAQQEMQQEALDSRLQSLVEQGKITQEQADQYKTWVQSRPDMSQLQQQMEQWQQARPDMPLPGSFGHFGSRGGMMGGGGRFFGGR